jgi:succinate dehydrogenase/fumarate reductase cytochrome b subunit
MQITLIVALVLHVLSGVFWAGTTFALARTGGNEADRFFRPQMGAAAVVVVTGGLLWFLLHHGPLGMQGHILAIGALCALLAVGVQGMMGAPALRKLSAMGDSDELRHRVARSQRIAAALLAITVTCMAAARYA